MKELRYTLLSDGSSDRALIPLLTWLLRAHGVECAIQPRWADLRRVPKPPKKLSERIRLSLDLYPCDLLFIHRDAEKESYKMRVTEIQEAISEASISLQVLHAVCVVPVRMQEAWLLFDEAAVRRAAGNPHGRTVLQLPVSAQIEQLPDPKSVLYKLLRDASELKGRRLKHFPFRERAQRVAELIDSFEPLRSLTAFRELEVEIKQVLLQVLGPAP